MYIYTTFNTKEITRIYMHGRQFGLLEMQLVHPQLFFFLMSLLFLVTATKEYCIVLSFSNIYLQSKLDLGVFFFPRYNSCQYI